MYLFFEGLPIDTWKWSLKVANFLVGQEHSSLSVKTVDWRDGERENDPYRSIGKKREEEENVCCFQSYSRPCRNPEGAFFFRSSWEEGMNVKATRANISPCSTIWPMSKRKNRFGLSCRLFGPLSLMNRTYTDGKAFALETKGLGFRTRQLHFWPLSLELPLIG